MSKTLPKKLMPQEVTGLDIAFGTKAMKLLPPMSEIPQEFHAFRGNSKWLKVVNDWFYHGLKNIVWKPKDGISQPMAVAHIRVCMGSFEPQHEHKVAGCAYLLSLWFDDVKYELAK